MILSRLIILLGQMSRVQEAGRFLLQKHYSKSFAA